MDDRQLIAGLLAGDEKAQDLFYAQYRARLGAVCVHFLGWQDPDCDDLVQETFALALKNIASFDFRRDLYSWLNKICVNLCFKRLKRRQRLVMATAEELELASEAKAEELHRAAENRSEESAARALLREVHEGMGKACREIIQLRDFEGRAYADIARILRVAPGTVFSRLARCRASLKALVLELKGPGGPRG